MLKSFIRSLTDYINNNRQDIITTLKFSSILTAGIMAMFAFHPALMSVWAYMAVGLDTMLLGFTFAIESTAHVIYEAAAMLGAGIAKVAAYLYASMVALLTVGGEWATAFKQFLSLPLLEMANVSIENIGYFFTGFLLFILTMLSVIVKRKVIKDIKKLYTDDEIIDIDSPFKGISPLTLALLFISLPIIVAASILHHLFSKSEEENGEDQKQKNG